MIQKIQSNEYLKRLDNMSVADKEDYMKRVGEWLKTKAPILELRTGDEAARFQNVLQCSAAWNDAESKAWNEGAKLLSALAASHDTWLPDMLYNKAAKRCIGRMVECLSNVLHVTSSEKPAEKGAEMAAQAVAPFQDAAGNGGVAVENNDSQGKTDVKPVPVRPKHIDQYVHLLPQKTQEKASTVKGLLRELDVARENMRLLMDDPKSSADSRAQWSTAASKLDEKINKIYKELDAEWDKLVQSGRVTVDDFGNAHISEEQEVKAEEPKAENAEKKVGRPPMTDEEKKAAAEKRAAERAAAKAAEDARKASLIRKFLIDTRNAKTDAQQEKWIAKYKEMISLGGESSVTDKVREAAQFYDIDLSKI